MFKITIGIPNATDFFHHKFVQSLMSLKYPPDTEIAFSLVLGRQLPFARNQIVSEALANGSDYLLFLDADMVFPNDLLTRLFENKKDICNALAFRRISPFYPCVFFWDEKNQCYNTADYSTSKDKLMKVDATGMPAILINTEVFKKMKKPHYYYRDNLFSSDLTFCENARKLGYEIWIDTSLKIGHLGEQLVIDESFYMASMLPGAKKQWNDQMKKNLECHRATEKENY